MPIQSEEKKIDENGEQKDALAVTFTNGAKQQISELKDFFNQSSELELIKLAISVLQEAKESRTRKTVNPSL